MVGDINSGCHVSGTMEDDMFADLDGECRRLSDMVGGGVVGDS
jgi:hypothetical protein